MGEDQCISCLKDEAMIAESPESMKETIKSAAQKLTGFRRRQFQW